MTREEAINKVAHATKTDFGRTVDINGADTLIRALEAVGVLKLDPEDDLIRELKRCNVQHATGQWGLLSAQSARELALYLRQKFSIQANP